jgi:hypothetical protein
MKLLPGGLLASSKEEEGGKRDMTLTGDNMIQEKNQEQG